MDAAQCLLAIKCFGMNANDTDKHNGLLWMLILQIHRCTTDRRNTRNSNQIGTAAVGFIC